MSDETERGAAEPDFDARRPPSRPLEGRVKHR
jgi:hypothetical protein